MRRAVIDIGTNTVKLFVAEVQQRQVVPIVSKDRTTRLGEGVNESGRLSARAMERTIQAINEFQGEAKALNVVEIITITTSASRDAMNRDEFFDGVGKVCGLEVDLISGDREAELIFRGVSSDPEWSATPIVVTDVGGGSAEFIQGRDGKMEWSQSLPLGALRLTETFGEGGFAELCDYLREVLRPAFVPHARGRRMIGTGGTIVTLGRIMRADGSRAGAQPFNDEVDHLVISRTDLEALVRRLEALSLSERKKVAGLPAERADIIVAGGAVFLVAMDLLEAGELTISIRNLRYGACLDAIS